MSSSRESTQERLLQDAKQLALLVQHLDKSDVLFAVGFSDLEAHDKSLKNELKSLVKPHVHSYRPPTDDDGRTELTVNIFNLMKRNPDKPLGKGGVKITDAMKFAMWPPSKAKSGTKEYQRIFRIVENQRKNDTVASSSSSSGSRQRPAAVTVPRPSRPNDPPVLSPMTMDEEGSFFRDSVFFGSTEPPSPISTINPASPTSTVQLPDDFDENYYVWPLTYPTERETEGSKRPLLTLPTLTSRSKPQSLQLLTTTRNVRNSSQAAHQERQILAEGNSIKSSVFKAATVLWDGVARHQNTLKVFDTPEKVADAFNQLSGIELLSGNELQAAVYDGNVGKSPTRKGRPSSVPDDEFKAFCDAVYTFSSLQQINSISRSTRSELLSLVGEIVNTKREADGDPVLGETNFFRRIELENASKQRLANPDKRESIRVRWLTYLAQELNYKRWEETAVELGFARWPRKDEETNGEQIVWFEGQEYRVLNIDEMSLSLDASSTRGGGRPSQTPVAIDVAGDGGDAAPKSSDKVTVIYGMNFGNEALTPYVQFPTKAKEEKRYKLQSKVLTSLRQVKGKFGYDQERYFDTGFGMNKKGGMNTKAFAKYVLEFLIKHYPDAQDAPLYRVLLKIDSGPGRFNPVLQQRLRSRGFYMFPGLPNGTEVGQEMDQLYSYAKTLCYRNRDRLYKARNAINEADMSPLSFADVGHLMFGGIVQLDDGNSIELEAAFDMAFDDEHLQKAKEKCGYLPSTRAALKNPKVRHEVVMSEQSDDDATDVVDVEADPVGALYESLEKQNHAAVELLVESGYDLATKLKDSIRRVKSSQVIGRQRVLTEPNSRERQDMLMKVGSAGQYFQVTNGGGPMNSNDALIAWARKGMLAKADKMKSKREACQYFEATAAKVEALLQNKPLHLWQKWTIAELKLVVSWKQGAAPKAPYDHKLSGLSKKALQSLYETTYSNVPNPVQQSLWTEEMSRKLERLESGEIENFFEETGLQRALDTDEAELRLRLCKTVPSRRSRVVKAAFRSLDKAARTSLFDELASMIEDETDDEDDADEDSDDGSNLSGSED